MNYWNKHLDVLEENIICIISVFWFFPHLGQNYFNFCLKAISFEKYNF